MTGPMMVVPTKMLLGATLGALLGFSVGRMGTATGGKKDTGARGAEEVRTGCTEAGMLLLLAVWWVEQLQQQVLLQLAQQVLLQLGQQVPLHLAQQHICD